MLRRCFLLVGLLMLAAPLPAQESKEITARQAAAMRKTRALLNTPMSLKPTELPFGKFLEMMEKELGEGKKLALRIDAEAFGKDAVKVTDAPIKLPKMLGVTLGTIIRVAQHQVAVPTDYRLGDGEFVITTPAQAMYTASYDVRDFVDNPEMLPGAFRGELRRVRGLDGAQRAAALSRLIVSTVSPESWYPAARPHGTIHVVNGNRLVIHANAVRHAEVAELFDALRRLNDVSVSVDARLYSVDRETYLKVKNRKRPTRAELEDQEAKGDATGVEIAKLLKAQNLVARGESTRIANAQEGTFLSQYRIVVVPPLSDRALPGAPALTDPQAAPEGVSFTAGVVVSADRRFVRLKITEKATEIDALPKPLPRIKKPEGKEPDVQEQVEELLAALRRAGPLEPVLSESSYLHEAEVPDGGSRVMAVHVRPRSLESAERWWVLVASARIHIKEEEQALREISLNAGLKNLLTDILTNPRLKTTRAFYGSADDNRWAAVPSERFAWPAEPPAIPEHTLAPAAPKGKRLLGIRIDDYQFAGKDSGDLTITVTLLNAGGDENGAAPGGCRLRYTIRPKEKDKPTKVELVD